MATKNNAILDEYEKTQMADMYGLPKDFIDRNTKTIQEVNKFVAGLVSNYGYSKNNTKGSNPMEDLSLIVKSSLKRPDADVEKNGGSTSSGIRGIQMNTISMGEQDIIASFSKLNQTSFALMGEYRSIVKFVPELQRVIQIMSRDILNRDEFSKKALKDTYKDSALSKNDQKRMNEQVENNIIEKYGLESRIPTWIEASLTEGAHPVAVFPYKDILEQITSIPGARVAVSKESGELCSVEYDKQSVNTLCESHIFNNESTLTRKKITTEAFDTLHASTRVAMESIVDDDLAEELFDEAYENFNERIRTIQNRTDSFTEESQIIDNKALAKIDDIINRTDDESIRKSMRAKVSPLVEIFDSNIEVIDASKASALIARRDVNQRKKLAEGTNVFGNTPIGNDIIELTAPGIRENKSDKKEVDSIMDKFKNSELTKEVLLVEYEPESVIPVVVNGQHVGYYVIEYDAFYGSEWKARKRIGSFTDIVQSAGFGNDAAMVSSVNSIADTDPLTSNMFTPMPIMAGSQMMMNSGGMLDEDRRIETLKRIAINTISHRLKDPSIVEDKRFRDAVMHLLRNGYLLKKKIMITYIPATHMVYFAHKIDTSGMPVSLLDGTLMTLYMYVSSKISSLMLKLMKSADKEKLLVNMGMTRQLNYTLTEIEKSLSTRNIHVASLFSNTGQVVRNASTFQRVKIPVVDGEQLYDVQSMERTNDLNPDDDFTQKLLDSVLLKIGTPPSFTNSLSESEYSKSLTMQNLDYRASIMDRQSIYERDVEKLIRLIGTYSEISIANEDSSDKKKTKDGKRNRVDLIKFDPENVKVRFTVPTFLSVGNINEQLSNAQTLIDQFTTILVGDKSDSISQAQIKLFKIELYKRFANSVDWNDITKVLEDVKRGRITEILQNKADANTSELIDGQGADTEQYGSGGGDESGGDSFGGDEGGGDMGGGDDFGGAEEGGGGEEESFGAKF